MSDNFGLKCGGSNTHAIINGVAINCEAQSTGQVILTKTDTNFISVD